MICKPCRKAGFILTASLEYWGIVKEHDKKIAAITHKMCKGGTWCDCAHKTELMVKRSNA
jgi:hypothetical protein